MARFTTDLRLTFEAEDVNEAHSAAFAMLPAVGPMRLAGGEVTTLVAAHVAGARPEGWVPPNALFITSDDVREEVTDGQWSAAAQDAVDKVSGIEINDRLSDRFGDDFWDAMHATYRDVISEICDDANIPPEDR
jgi:hypothetical protein